MKLFLLLCTYLIVVCSSLAQAASLGVWPINPRIDAPAGATMVWVKNNNKSEPVILQARIFIWRQVNNEDKLDPQDELVVSPPLIEVKPDAQQIFRLMNRKGELKDVTMENSYRLLIDEVPKEGSITSSLLRFQMRYSLPLFVGLPEGYSTPLLDTTTKTLEANLRYRIVDQPSPAIEIINQGPVHARLSNVIISNSDPAVKSYYVSQGLLGYVLPYATRRWPLVKEQLDTLLQKNSKLTFEQDHQELLIVAEK